MGGPKPNTGLRNRADRQLARRGCLHRPSRTSFGLALRRASTTTTKTDGGGLRCWRRCERDAKSQNSNYRKRERAVHAAFGNTASHEHLVSSSISPSLSFSAVTTAGAVTETVFGAGDLRFGMKALLVKQKKVMTHGLIDDGRSGGEPLLFASLFLALFTIVLVLVAGRGVRAGWASGWRPTCSTSPAPRCASRAATSQVREATPAIRTMTLSILIFSTKATRQGTIKCTFMHDGVRHPSVVMCASRV